MWLMSCSLANPVLKYSMGLHFCADHQKVLPPNIKKWAKHFMVKSYTACWSCNWKVMQTALNILFVYYLRIVLISFCIKTAYLCIISKLWKLQKFCKFWFSPPCVWIYISSPRKTEKFLLLFPMYIWDSHFKHSLLPYFI